MDGVLMYLSTGIILCGFLWYFIMIVFNKKKTITSSNGFNVTKDILHEYDSINIIENKSLFTIYNIKRKVIKIASKCYYGNSISDICIPLMEAGISVVDNGKNKYINFFSKFINNLKYLYILPLLVIIVGNTVSYNTTDIEIGIFLLVICSAISYLIIDIKSSAFMWLSKNIKAIKNVDKEAILKYINRIILCDKFIFIGELIMIIRFVQILLK